VIAADASGPERERATGWLGKAAAGVPAWASLAATA
jgi:hypothetical protein